MPSCRPRIGTRSRRLLLALVTVIVAGGDPQLEGDDSAASEDAQVELNSAHGPGKATQVAIDMGDSKDVSVQPDRTRRKNVVEINLADSKDATVEVVRERAGPNVEIKGYRMNPRLKQSRLYLFGQEQVVDPPLPPSEFNPDPGGGNLIEPIEPPELFPPILPDRKS